MTNSEDKHIRFYMKVPTSNNSYNLVWSPSILIDSRFEHDLPLLRKYKQTGCKEKLHTHTHTHPYLYIDIYAYICILELRMLLLSQRWNGRSEKEKQVDRHVP